MAQDKIDNAATAKIKPIFREINADDPDPEATIIESLCMNCGKNVSTQFQCSP